MSGTEPPRTVAELQALAGREIAPGPWIELTQAMVDEFAALTGDEQYIHVDPARAGGTMFGGTVAHGYLTLSLLPRLTPGRDALLAGLGGRCGSTTGSTGCASRPRCRWGAGSGPAPSCWGRRRWRGGARCRSPGATPWR